MAYDPAVVAAIREIGQQRYANDPKKLRRYLEGQYSTGIVESGLRDLKGGDADSYGYRQQRLSGYGKQDLKTQINNLYNEFEQYDKGQPLGELIADVQRPAEQYRGRYGEASVMEQARKLAMGQGNSGAGAASLGAQSAPASVGGTMPGATAAPPQSNVFDYLATMSAPTAKPNAVASPNDALQAQLQRGWTLLSQVQNQRQQAATPAVSNDGATFQASPQQEQNSSEKLNGVGEFEGTNVAGWISPILQYAREHGWKGAVNSGFRSLEDQTRIYNSGVRPAAKPGTSNHENPNFPGGAVDVSDAEQLSQILANSPYKKKLVWAGSKDPVHFSFPHNGSY